MRKNGANKLLLPILLLTGCLAAGPALADKPDFAGGGQGGGKHSERADREMRGHPEKRKNYSGGEYEREQRGSSERGYRSGDSRADYRFQPDKRIVVRDYYAGAYRSGRCPPGLAKKHNGCQPPGQAKRWAVGRPLPRDVIYYDLPDALIIQLGLPPTSHRYVRIGADILMIAIGTGMVVDAIEDLGNM